ncbi:MAG: SDR family oxidoreductase [Myxococcota bacterium]|nr:SDR family oxidoreductase [Myxococcota bacterium]
MRIVVTGASRGIGLELVKQLLARGDVVDAAVRDPDRATDLRALERPTLHVHRCDVTDQASVDSLARAIAAPVDVVINNAGINLPRQKLTDLDLAATLELYATNAIGPLRVTHALLPHVRRGTVKKLVHVTSGMGSIADNQRGESYGYRMSKAALNMMSKSLAVDLRGEGIVSFVINPGWVKTDLGGTSAPTPVGDSARGILARIDEATLETSGSFLNWSGGTYPW